VYVACFCVLFNVHCYLLGRPFYEADDVHLECYFSGCVYNTGNSYPFLPWLAVMESSVILLVWHPITVVLTLTLILINPINLGPHLQNILG